MTDVYSWFERRFDFSLPVELRPNVVARLRGTPARLEDALRGRAREVLVRKSDGKWSAQEHAGHLADLEPLWLARFDDYAAGRERMTAADLTNRRTEEANHNARPLEDILRDFRTARDLLIRRSHEAESAVMGRTLPHPRMQTPMRLFDHLYFVAEHDDHHLAHIWALIEEA